MALLEVKGLFFLAGKIYAANPVIRVEIEVDGKEKSVVKSVRAGNGLIFSQNSHGDFKVIFTLKLDNGPMVHDAEIFSKTDFILLL